MVQHIWRRYLVGIKFFAAKNELERISRYTKRTECFQMFKLKLPKSQRMQAHSWFRLNQWKRRHSVFVTNAIYMFLGKAYTRRQYLAEFQTCSWWMADEQKCQITREKNYIKKDVRAETRRVGDRINFFLSLLLGLICSRIVRCRKSNGKNFPWMQHTFKRNNSTDERYRPKALVNCICVLECDDVFRVCRRHRRCVCVHRTSQRLCPFWLN